MSGASHPDLESRTAATGKGTTPALTLAGVAALLASTCCVLPLVFALVGVSGAWIGELRLFEPYSPWLMALAIASLASAAWRLYRSSPRVASACDADDRACRLASATSRRWFWLVAVLTLIPLVVPLVAPVFY